MSGFTNADTSMMSNPSSAVNASAGGSDRDTFDGSGAVLRQSSAAGEISVGSFEGGVTDLRNNRQFHTGSVRGTEGVFFKLNTTTGIWTIVLLLVVLFLTTSRK